MTGILKPEALLDVLRGLIDAAREHVAQSANSALTVLYWQIGKRVREDVLRDGRAAYGEQFVYALGSELTAAYGQGFGETNLRRILRFSEASRVRWMSEGSQ